MQNDAPLDSPKARRTSAWMALLMLLVGLSLTGFAVHTSQERIETESWYRFSLQFDRLDASVRERLRHPLSGLQGLAGLYDANGKFDAQSFARWVATQDLSQQYQGVLGFGYMERTRQANGADRYVVRHLEPTEANARYIGVEASADEILAEALRFVATSGEASLANMIPDPQGRSNPSEFLLFAPFYGGLKDAPPNVLQKDRLRGLLFARVDLNTLLLPSISIAEGLTDFEISDGATRDGRTLAFSSEATIAAGAAGGNASTLPQRRYHNRRGLVIGSKLLYLQAGSSARFDAQIDHTTPAVVGVTGAVLSFLLTITFWLVIEGRTNAQLLVQRRTRDLNRMARVVRSTSHLVFVADAEQRLEWANEAFCQYVGKSESEVQGLRIGELLFLKSEQESELNALRSAVAARQSRRVQLPLQSEIHGTRWFDVDLQTERDEGGNYAGYMVIAADITVQREATDKVANAMRESQALLDAIDEHSIVSISDPSGNIIYANDMFSQVSGYSKAELIGQNHRVVKSDQQSDEYWARMWKTISSGYHWRDTVCNRAKDGSYYWVDTVIAPFFGQAGNIEKYISIRTNVTMARRVQQELQDERKHLQAILEGTNAGTWEWEIPTGINIVNERWAQIVGYTLEELGEVSIQTWAGLCNPDDMPAAQAILERHFAGEIDYFEREFRMRHKLGHWVWVQSRGKVSSWLAPGKPQWVSGIHLDVTEQKNLQSALHQNNLVMQSILDNIPVALSVFDGNLKLIARNERFTELLDLPQWLFDVPVVTFESIIRYNATRGEYGEGDVESTIQGVIDRARQTVAHQFERDRPNGTALEVRGAPMPGGGFITTYADITERRRAAAEVARTTQMLQSVLDSASEISVIAIDLRERITLFNKGAERLLGYRASEAVGKLDPRALFDRDELQARGSAMSAQLGRPIQGLQALLDDSVLGKRHEWTHIHKNGQRFASALVMTAILDSRGQRTGYLSVSHDITQQKAHETQLQIAMEEAEQASTAKGQFLANMSHEIRTPMNAILGMLKLLQNTSLDARQQDYATKTENAARSLLGLLNDILDFSKTEAGKMVLDPQPFRIDQVLRELSVILAANVGTKGIEILFEVDPAIPPELVGDSMRLEQILINLGGNAVKFTERGEVVVSLVLQALEDGRARIGIAVRDSGIGIDTKNQQHIFSGFSQAEASTTRRFGGTGLGLSICRRLVALMGGELQLQSELGKGSTFHFSLTLPIAKDLDGVAMAEGVPSGPARHILIVDDHAHAREVMAALARSLGWTVDVAEDATAALVLAEAAQHGTPYGAIFMDCQMPGMDGWEGAHRIRALPGGDAPVLIMLTTRGGEITLQQTEHEGRSVDGFLVKPLTASMLYDAVSEAEGQRQHPGQRKTHGKARPQRLAGMRLLVVEDNMINQQVAKELLGAEGATIVLADNGQLGVDAVAHAVTPFDAVLMDIQMPVMDGYTAAVTIRHELGRLDLPIIAMTANAMASDREACLAAGMNDHIGKPFDVPQLVSMLLRHTGYMATASTPTTAPEAGAPAPTALPEPAADALLDVASALAMLGDNTDLYCQIAEAYLAEIRSFAQRLEGWLALDDMAEATRSLHTIKGLSLTVGAKYLSGICRIGESQLKASTASGGQPDQKTKVALCADVSHAVARTVAALEEFLAKTDAQKPPEPEPPAPIPVDAAALAQDLSQLRTLLAASDMRAVDVHAALRRKHGAALAQLQGLYDALQAFDFAQGVIQCDTLLREISLQN